jgi:hypothetical protein
MVRKYLTLLAALGLGVLAGCGSSGPTKTAGGNRDALDELGQGLKSLAEENRKPPASLASFGDLEPQLPVAGPLVRDGSIVYLWGAPYAAGSQTVVAYEKQVPAEGGFALLQDGTVKEMTAAEFGAAPKAKK